MTSSVVAFELFTLPTQVDISGPFWTKLKENDFFVLQQAKTQRSGLMRSVLGTLQNVYVFNCKKKKVEDNQRFGIDWIQSNHHIVFYLNE